MATLSQSEWKAIRARQSIADLKYLIALLRRDGEISMQDDGKLHIRGPLDRIFYDAPDRLVIHDDDRRLVIEKRGFPECVVWNPGPEGTKSRADFAPDDEKRMLCVEAAVIRQAVQLAPGASWTGEQRMTAI